MFTACVEGVASNAVSATQPFKSLPNTAPLPADRVGPRTGLPKTGPAGIEYASESERDEDVVDDATLQDPEGALGVRRCLVLPMCTELDAVCFGANCEFECSKSSADGLLNDAVWVDEEDECPLPEPECIPPHARPIFSTARLASPAEKPLVMLTAAGLALG